MKKSQAIFADLHQIHTHLCGGANMFFGGQWNTIWSILLTIDLLRHWKIESISCSVSSGNNLITGLVSAAPVQREAVTVHYCTYILLSWLMPVSAWMYHWYMSFTENIMNCADPIIPMNTHWDNIKCIMLTAHYNQGTLYCKYSRVSRGSVDVFCTGSGCILLRGYNPHNAPNIISQLLGTEIWAITQIWYAEPKGKTASEDSNNTQHRNTTHDVHVTLLASLSVSWRLGCMMNVNQCT